ncbi:MAG: hypothetical protein V3575_01830 [Candidatus Absconditabacteria bacterium]
MGKLILNSIVASLVFSSIFILSLYITKAWSPDSSGLTAQNGDVLTADKWNQLVPNSMVGAFMADSCPTGWKPADGTDGTVDLRGQFLRGINSFDNGTSTRTDGKEDPDGASRTIGTFQDDQFQTHTHSSSNSSHNVLRIHASGSRSGIGTGPNDSFGVITVTVNAPNSGKYGTETRGKNIGVIYCVKK